MLGMSGKRKKDYDKICISEAVFVYGSVGKSEAISATMV
jgi:hypothetical protein